MKTNNQSKLFEKFTINRLTLKNRFIMSAAADNLNNSHDAQLKRFAELAKGQIGLIISGGTRTNKIAIWEDVINVVHENGGKFAVQITAESGPGIFMGNTTGNEDVVAVSELPEDHLYFKSLAPFVTYGKHHAATERELEEIIDRYAKAALLAKEIGADAIQIHAAHQNFLSQILSPLTNLRKDKWGGSIENRTRLHREVCQAIRKKVGNNYPVLIKFGAEDKVAGGLRFAEGRKAAQIIGACGYDAMEISQGLQNYSDWSKTPMHPNVQKSEDEAYFRSYCHEIKKVVSIPTILTGGIRSIPTMEQLLNNNTTDCFGMCRPFIREPNLIKRWQSGDHSKATCISCNKCLTELFLQGKPLECYLDEK
ncbi:MAG: NADH:flavin oxidoreductase [Gammaproteobacteria bacterium]|nr:NADH:flavin oxidoreductase [Gammaproteobacteria bacterium]